MTDYHKFTTIFTPKEARARRHIGDIWINGARCKKCNDFIVSKNVHDMATCKCGSISVDGGSWYAKRSGYPNLVDNMIILYNDLEDKNGESFN